MRCWIIQDHYLRLGFAKSEGFLQYCGAINRGNKELKRYHVLLIMIPKIEVPAETEFRGGVSLVLYEA